MGITALKWVGYQCNISGKSTTERLMNLGMVRQYGKCPACGHSLPEGALTQYSACEGCGIVFAKYRGKSASGSDVTRPRRRLIKSLPKRTRKPQPLSVGRDQKVDAYVEAHRKSIILSILLAVVFGPIGMLYVSIPGALGMILFGLGVAFAAPGVVGIVGAAIWVMSIIFAPGLAWSHNDRMRSEAELLAGGRD